MADSIAASRVRREINEFQKKADCAGIVLELEDNDLMKLKGSITGPPDTSYAGGTYKLAIGEFINNFSYGTVETGSKPPFKSSCDPVAWTIGLM